MSQFLPASLHSAFMITLHLTFFVPSVHSAELQSLAKLHLSDCPDLSSLSELQQAFRLACVCFGYQPFSSA